MVSTMPRFSSDYRPDLDGLRAFAVLSVVIFHAFPGRLSGGFVGVDVFFVISGFLISGILFRNLAAGSFAFSAFYANRIRRIFPALIVVLAATALVGWQVLLPDELKQLGRHMFASAAFLQNFALLQEQGYFDAATELKPLMHLWSLAIEEQYYLLYPFLIWGAWRLRLNWLTVVVVLLVLSFVGNIQGVEKNAAAGFFRPGMRFWELLAGGVLAYACQFYRAQTMAGLKRLLLLPVGISPTRGEGVVLRKKGDFSNPEDLHILNLLAVLGLMLLLAAVLLIEKGAPFPGYRALLPVCGTLCLLLAGPEAWINRKILAHRVMVFVGLVSYPFYLWHWPLLSFAQVMEGEVPSRLTRLALIGVSFVLAWLTWALVEKPLRFGRKTNFRVALLVTGMVLLGGLGWCFYKSAGFPTRTAEFERITHAIGDFEYPGTMEHQESQGIAYDVRVSGRKEVALLVGDSNIAQFYPRVAALIEQSPEQAKSVFFLTRYGCPPGLDAAYYDEKTRQACGNYLQEAVTLARAMPEIKTVAVAGIWNYYFGHDEELKRNYPNTAHITHNLEYGSEGYHAALAGLSAGLKELRSLGKETWLVLTIPIGMELAPRYMTERRLSNFPQVFRIRTGGFERAALEAKYAPIYADLTRIANEAGAHIIDPTATLCDATRCEALTPDGAPIYTDAIHLNASFARQQARFIDPLLLQ
jgi:peptidoglycan/LPS O-acetylase OafA/YrhL